MLGSRDDGGRVDLEEAERADRLEDVLRPVRVQPLGHDGELASPLDGQPHATTVACLLPSDEPLMAGPVRPANRFREAGKENRLAVPGPIGGDLRRADSAQVQLPVSTIPAAPSPRASALVDPRVGDLGPALLALEDGTVFPAIAFGAPVAAGGDLVVNTSQTGYQEVCTDPSYAGQVVVMTYPLIGNYGRLAAPTTSRRGRGCAASSWPTRRPRCSTTRASSRRCCATRASRRSPGIDTRALARHLRANGCLRGIDHGARRARSGAPRSQRPGPCRAGRTRTSWRRSRRPRSPTSATRRGRPLDRRSSTTASRRTSCASLRRRGVRVRVLPHTAPARRGPRRRGDGVVLSPGPGDPARLDGPVALARAAIDDGRPLLGICLGHQIVARAAGAETRRLRFGHHGANHPVRDLDSGLVQVTAQNHEVQVVGETLPAARRLPRSARSTSTTARSRGCATASCRSRPSSTTPEGAPGPLDALAVFDRFVAAAGGARDGRPGGDGRRPRRVPPEARVGADPRLRARRDRPGGRVRLRRDPGLPRAARRGRPHDPRQLQPGDDHDRPARRGRRLPRAAHGRGGRGGHRPRAARGAARRPRRPDGPEPGDGPRRGRRPRAAQRQLLGHAARGDPDGRGPRGVPRPARSARPAVRALGDRRGRHGRGAPRVGGAGAGRDRPAGDHPARRSRSAARAAASSRPRRPTASGSARACGPARSARSWSSAASSAGRRSSTRSCATPTTRASPSARWRTSTRSGVHTGDSIVVAPVQTLPDAGPPAAAQRGAGDHPGARRRGRLQRPVRALARLDRVRGHRGQPARLALVGAGLEGDRLSDRAGRRPDRRRAGGSPRSRTSSPGRRSPPSSRRSTTSSSSCRASRSTSSPAPIARWAAR